MEIDNDRTVRSAFVRMKKTLAENRDLVRKMEKLQDAIKKSQYGLDPSTGIYKVVGFGSRADNEPGALKSPQYWF